MTEKVRMIVCESTACYPSVDKINDCSICVPRALLTGKYLLGFIHDSLHSMMEFVQVCWLSIGHKSNVSKC